MAAYPPPTAPPQYTQQYAPPPPQQPGYPPMQPGYPMQQYPPQPQMGYPPQQPQPQVVYVQQQQPQPVAMYAAAAGAPPPQQTVLKEGQYECPKCHKICKGLRSRWCGPAACGYASFFVIFFPPFVFLPLCIPDLKDECLICEHCGKTMKWAPTCESGKHHKWLPRPPGCCCCCASC